MPVSAFLREYVAFVLANFELLGFIQLVHLRISAFHATLVIPSVSGSCLRIRSQAWHRSQNVCAGILLAPTLSTLAWGPSYSRPLKNVCPSMVGRLPV